VVSGNARHSARSLSSDSIGISVHPAALPIVSGRTDKMTPKAEGRSVGSSRGRAGSMAVIGDLP
jgi:hypothetical protein